MGRHRLLLDQGLPKCHTSRRKIENKLEMVERYNTWLERQGYQMPTQTR